MNFYRRKLVKTQDLNGHGTLFGGTVLVWIDEEAAIYVGCQLGKADLVTKFMSGIDFVSSAMPGDIIEIGRETVGVGVTSITVRSEARNKFTKASIIKIDEIVFVHIDAKGKPAPHNMTRPETVPVARIRP